MFLLPATLYEIKGTKKMGRGVFAKKDIEGGTVIGDYMGKIMKAEDEPAGEHFYGMYRNDTEVILPDNPDAPGIHLINHSCAPNCAMYPYKGHVLYVALRKIFKGEELTVSYFVEPDDEKDDAVFLCHCRSPFCRGTMYTSLEYSDRFWNYFMRPMHGKYFNEKIVEFGQELPRLAAYPATVPDNEIYDLYANQDKTPYLAEDAKMPRAATLRKLLREEGRPIKFKEMNLTVLGIAGSKIIAASGRP